MNLRAALFRVLSDLKKNGDLGKETILRKSMLDDCKGDKFDELLAIFSTNVLRKVLSASIDESQLDPALRLSLATGISNEDYQLALPLLLAHLVSIGQSGDRRARVRGTFDRFSELLDNKKTQLEQRFQEKPQSGPQEPADLDRLTDHVKTNWLGSEEWADNLLNGGSRSSSDAFLELPFTEAWAKANESTVEGLTAGASRDLLLDLESRVSQQRDRLNRWREYGDISGDRDGQAPSPSTSTTNGNSVLAFKDHQALTVASISKAVREPGKRASPTEEDQSLLLSMNEALAHIDGKSRSLVETGPMQGAADTLTSHNPGRQEPMELAPTDTPEPEREPKSLQDLASELEPEPTPAPVHHEHLETASPTVSISEAAPEEQPNPDNTDTHPFTLAERTRQSMCLIPPRNTQQQLSQPRDQNPSRRQSRMSFPINQFETPQKRAPSRTPTPRDDLFEDDVDYASVFKSRPRIAQSPVSSPAVHVSPLGDFDLHGAGAGEEGMDQEGFEGYSELGLDSPSVRKR